MTAPGQDAPDGAWTLGSGMGQHLAGMSPDDVVAVTTSTARADLTEAVDGYTAQRQQQSATRAEHTSGQQALKNRLDLLQSVAGHACAFMGYNWTVPHSTWVVLPFDTQLGPVKRAGVVTPADNSGWLVLKAGGLWQIDAHATVQGYSIGVTFYWLNNILYTITNYNPIVPTYMLEVVDAHGNLLSPRRFDAVTGVSPNQQSTDAVNLPVSSYFSHTFVVEDMPPEDDPAAPQHWVYVRLSMKWEPVYSGTFNGAQCKAIGGTKLSSLTASRWSRDVAHNVVAPTVPDGGDLT
ncbi:hypothetical protein [Rhodococcus aetherivorans]|uniref:hypothetical protein n=1 Tax=Rhodococcus aetherivorans TaxID=191292 RepID=UPI00388CFE3C